MKLSLSLLALTFLLTLIPQFSSQESCPHDQVYLPIANNPFLTPFFFGTEKNMFPMNCAMCTLLVNTLTNYTNTHNTPLDDFLFGRYCNLFDIGFQDSCNIVIQVHGPKLLNAMKVSTNPDKVCRQLNFCTKQECALFPEDHQPKITLSLKNLDQCYDYKGDFEPLALITYPDKDDDSFP